jgi:hypothetical protein
MTTPIIGAPDWADEQATPWTTENKAKRMIEAMARAGIIDDRDLSAPPGSCADGACYLIATSPTGAWAGQAGKLAIAVGTDAASGWYFVTVAAEGVTLYVRDENAEIFYDGSAWVTRAVFNLSSAPANDGDILYYDLSNNEYYPAAAPSSANPTESIIVALSDESTALTAGTDKVKIRMPYAFVLTAVRASLSAAGGASGNPVQVDINEGGVSILSTKLTIDPGETTSTTALVPPVISDTALADDAEITFDIDDPGDGATGLKVYLIGAKP